MKKQTKNLTVSKIKTKKETEQKIDLEFMIKDFKNKISGGFQILNSTLLDIPINIEEIRPILYDLQKTQGWIHFFLDSLTEKQPPNDTSP